MIIEILVVWLVTAFGLWLATRIVPGVSVVSTRGLWQAALVLGLVNAIIKPVLWFFTLPLTVLTFGLFALVVNALMLQLTAWLVADFKIRAFGSALLAALVMAILSLLEFIIVQWLTYGYIQWSMGQPEPSGLYL
ncbi:MAG: phage holin family protein [Gammaproteobacteria bacterium]|jgi:putative membrane protein